MECSVDSFRKRLNEPWVEPALQAAVCESFEMGVAAFSTLPKGGRVLLVDDDPAAFIGGFLAGVALEKAVFLGSRTWGEREWEQVGAMLTPDLVWGECPSWGGVSVDDGHDLSGKIMITTGGSGGRVRFAYHTWHSLMASVGGTQTFLGGGPLNACCVLPLYHMSGLMQVLRTFATGGRLFLGDWKAWVEGDLPAEDFENYALSLVPTQLARLLDVAGGGAFLKPFKIIFLGGAPASVELLERGRALGLRLSPTYGMTETAAMVVAMDPGDFLAGVDGVGRALPHAAIALEGKEIVVRAQSLFHGYFPEKPEFNACYHTGDLGKADAEGRLFDVRRKDKLIITGGEKVDPQVVSEALLAIRGVRAAHVVGIDDSRWGQRVGVVYVADDGVDETVLKTTLREKLAPHMVPKSWARVDTIPVDEKGKVRVWEVLG